MASRDINANAAPDQPPEVPDWLWMDMSWKEKRDYLSGKLKLNWLSRAAGSPPPSHRADPTGVHMAATVGVCSGGASGTSPPDSPPRDVVVPPRVTRIGKW